MQNELVIKLAALAGQIMLEAGGETYRVEDTINRILTSYGISNAQSFVMPTGIVISGEHLDGSTISLVRRISAINVDLEKISMINDLSRRISQDKLTFEEFNEGLENIRRSPYYPLWITLMMTGFSAFCFTMIFRGTTTEAICAFFAGIAVYIMKRIAKGFRLNFFLQNAVGGITAVLAGSLFKQLNIIPTISLMVIGTIMLLVPGITITNAIRDTFQGDYISGVTRGVEAFVTASGIAFGTAIGFFMTGVI